MTTLIASSRMRRKPEVAEKRPVPFRFGELILLFFFVALLAGRFSLARLSSDATGLDLRYGFVFAGALLVAIWGAGAREYLPQRVPMIGCVGFTLWCGWMVLSAVWAPTGARNAVSVVDFGFLFTLVALSWFIMANLPYESLERVWTWLVVTGVIYFMLAIAAGPGAQGRYSAPGGGPNTFVRIMVVASIAALYLAIVKRKSWVLWLVPVFAVGAALSGSRGGLASAAVVMLIFLVPVLRRLGIGKSLLMLFFTAVGAVVAASWNNGYLVEFVTERFIQQTLVEGYSSGRDVIAADAWGMFLTHPVAGVGLNGYYVLQSGFSPLFEYPHNLVLATLAEAGVIGGALLVITLLRMILVSADKSIPTHVLFAIITGLYFFGAAMFSGDYYDSRFIWFFLAVATIGAARHRADKRAESALEL